MEDVERMKKDSTEQLELNFSNQARNTFTVLESTQINSVNDTFNMWVILDSSTVFFYFENVPQFFL